MSRDSRRSLVEEYKRREVSGGIYAIRSLSDDTQWIGQAPDLSTVWNRITFKLRSGRCRFKSLQVAWNTHEPSNFVFEVLEEIDAEEASFALDRVMKERRDYWCSMRLAHRL